MGDHADGAGRWRALGAERQLAPSGTRPMGKLRDGELGDDVGAACLGVREQAAQRLELGAHEPRPVQPRDRRRLVAAEQGVAIRDRRGELIPAASVNTGSTGWCAPERGAAPARRAGRRRSRRRPTALAAQLIGRGDALGEQRRDARRPAGTGPSASVPATTSASTPTSSLAASSAARNGRRLPRRRLDGGVRLAQRGERGVRALAQLGHVDRAGGAAGASVPTGRLQIGPLQRATPAHQPRRPRRHVGEQARGVELDAVGLGRVGHLRREQRRRARDSSSVGWSAGRPPGGEGEGQRREAEVGGAHRFEVGDDVAADEAGPAP